MGIVIRSNDKLIAATLIPIRIASAVGDKRILAIDQSWLQEDRSPNKWEGLIPANLLNFPERVVSRRYVLERVQSLFCFGIDGPLSVCSSIGRNKSSAFFLHRR